MKKFKLELKDWHERDPVNNKMPTIKGKIATYKQGCRNLPTSGEARPKSGRANNKNFREKPLF